MELEDFRQRQVEAHKRHRNGKFATTYGLGTVSSVSTERALSWPFWAMALTA
jgi:hypothetical protein